MNEGDDIPPACRCCGARDWYRLTAGGIWVDRWPYAHLVRVTEERAARFDFLTKGIVEVVARAVWVRTDVP